MATRVVVALAVEDIVSGSAVEDVRTGAAPHDVIAVGVLLDRSSAALRGHRDPQRASVEIFVRVMVVAQTSNSTACDTSTHPQSSNGTGPAWDTITDDAHR